MKSKVVLSLVLVSAIFFAVSAEVSAKRLLPQAGGGTTSTSGTSKSTGTKTQGVTSVVKFRSDRKAVNVTFRNLKIAKSVSYTLSYLTDKGITQGAGGDVSPTSPDPTLRELLFGTCSSGVCRYDTGITNAKLVVTTTLKNGRKIVKGFRLKV